VLLYQKDGLGEKNEKKRKKKKRKKVKRDSHVEGLFRNYV
jgi:hypothetical protein